jgi:CheY-like chemotaxis protein
MLQNHLMDPVTFKIVVAEDDADDRFLLDEAFQMIGYEAEIKKFIDGESLLAYLEKIDQAALPSLIVLDNSLPKLDAVEILARLKKEPLYKHIPVIIYSTEISPQRKNRLLSLGAYACIKKGTAMSDIVAVAKGLKAIADANGSGTNLVQT